MLYENRFKNPEDVPVILEKIRQLARNVMKDREA